MASPGLLKIIFFEKKGYNLIMPVHDVTNNILLRGLNSNVNVVMQSKFGSSSNSTREVIITSVL